MTRRRQRFGIGLLAIVTTGAIPAHAIGAHGSDPQPPALDLGAWNAHLDRLAPGWMDRAHVPGLAVAVVGARGEQLTLGFGFADVETAQPVVPETTLFRVASLTKIVTALAAVQLAERGQLQLSDDVRAAVPELASTSVPSDRITLEHLLTHTAGISDPATGVAESLDETPVPLQTHVARASVEFPYPPGQLVVYSNFGYAVAGLMLERASGVAYDEYVARQLLQPLRMGRSRIGVPPTPPPSLAQAYAWNGDALRDVGYDRLRAAPAAELVTTADDMARLMHFVLAPSRERGPSVLSEGGVRELCRCRFPSHPGLGGRSLAFECGHSGHWDTLEHNGRWRGFSSRLVLVPEAGLGIFVAVNVDLDPEHLAELDSALIRERLSAIEPDSVDARSDPVAKTSWRSYDGIFVTTNRIRRGVLSLSQIYAEHHLTIGANGELALTPVLAPRASIVFVPAGENEFLDVRGGRRLLVESNGDGTPRYLRLGGTSFEEIPWYAAPSRHAITAAIYTVLLFVAAVYAGMRPRRGGRARLHATSVAVLAIVGIDSALVLLLFPPLLGSTAWQLARGLPVATRVAGVFGWFHGLAVLWLVDCLIRRADHVAARALYALFAASAAGIFLMLGYWHVLDPMG